jgi:4-hydroxy-3-polyprenylbenzoate decarboxylase
MSGRVPQSYRDLHAFVAYLERRGQLKRIKTPVSADLEITEITDRVSKSSDSNYALLFERVEGFDIPVLINAMGTQQRMAWALGLDGLDQLRERMAGLVKPEVPESIFDKFRKLGELSEVVRYRPKTVDSADPHMLAGGWWTLYHIAAGYLS